METINYYDKIKRKNVELTVTNKVSKEIKKLNNFDSNNRRKVRQNECSASNIKGSENLFIDHTSDPLTALINKEAREQKNKKHAIRQKLVKKALNTLSKKELNVIEHVVCNNYTQAEAARKLGVSKGTIRYRYDSGMSKIKEFIINNE
jgi:RNA polymerase sigma factor (sigma-70 family)